jgi:DNA-binding response OmpR family regulator
MNVLIVEDELSLAREVSDFLTRERFVCDVAFTAAEASEKLSVNLYDFVLLDLGLPDHDGLEIITEARELNKDSAFIIITARGEVEDRIKGLDLGADDYLAKPFSLHELHSRMQAVARRKFGINSNDITAGDFILNLRTRMVMCNTQTVELTKKEFDLLLYLLINKNKTLTRVQLYEHIWGNTLDDQYDSNFIDVHIKNLRRKLSAHAPAEWLKTVRGVGYQVIVD